MLTYKMPPTLSSEGLGAKTPRPTPAVFQTPSAVLSGFTHAALQDVIGTGAPGFCEGVEATFSR